MAKRAKKRVSHRSRIIKLKPVEHKTSNHLAKYSFILSIISLIIFLVFIMAAFLVDGDATLLLFAYLAVLVVFIVAVFGVALAVVDLMSHPKHELSKKALYLSLIILAVTFALLLFRML